MADTRDLKSLFGNGVRVQVPPTAPTFLEGMFVVRVGRHNAENEQGDFDVIIVEMS